MIRPDHRLPGPSPVPARKSAGAPAVDRFESAHEQAPLDPRKAVPYYDAQADAAERERYYGSILQEPDLFGALHGLLESTHTFSPDYSSTLKAYPWVNLQPDGKLRCVYSGETFSAPTTRELPEYMKRPDQAAWLERWSQLMALSPIAPEVAATAIAYAYPEPYSAEHVVPQSWFGRSRPMRTDLHPLMVAENKANSRRGNLPLAELAQGQKVEGGLTDEKRFAPGQGRGEAARATLYFLLRYPGQIGDEPREYHPKDLATLLKWHRQYPPSEFEKHRNRVISHLQGNRNPLVDFPELADRIDFRKGFGST